MSSLPPHPYHLQNGEHSHIASYVPFGFGCSPASPFKNILCFPFYVIFKTVAKIIFFIYPTLRCIGGLRLDAGKIMAIIHLETNGFSANYSHQYKMGDSQLILIV